MKNTTPLFPGFHLQSLCKKKRSTARIMADLISQKKEISLWGLKACFGRFIPESLLQNNVTGHHSRHCIFNKETTFWAFFSQIIDADGGCAEVVKKLKSYLALNSEKAMSVSTGSYCKSRKKLVEKDLAKILKHTAKSFEVNSEDQPLAGCRVIVVDGTGLSMPDTPENQADWPQISSQKTGCGFPTMRLLGCFDLATGAILNYALGNKKSHELPLLRKQENTFKENDIFLGDKGFCSFYDINWLRKKGTDSIVTLARRIPKTEQTCIKSLANNDLIMSWKRPAWYKAAPLAKDEWNQLPKELLLRQIKVEVKQPGFRVKTFYIITTLLDPLIYSSEEITELYYRRWSVELFFRDLKTTMKMDILRCKTPAMIRKEILMYFIAYNALRHLIYETAHAHEQDPMRLSYKGALQALRQAEGYLNQAADCPQEIHRIRENIYDSIRTTIIPFRPGRTEPRCLKRRPKPYQLLTAPRGEMIEIKHRSKYRAKVA